MPALAFLINAMGLYSFTGGAKARLALQWSGGHWKIKMMKRGLRNFAGTAHLGGSGGAPPLVICCYSYG